ncbi:MAG: type II toxin-antitoxin system RelE/ParE family toxin [Alphaproteobacteria bacterium]|nr:type II toxin-antitoxin system RelE/ParE family toxin [Alphaproteobacteria bacterium]MBP7759744.1 type II toxin-antitoxin system RelE/ParE family toxin [Alphaproteobacteria bacterium]MBP7904473.1 type II toxin-antitoxin system RelE/ParE family toxin [Alphaproteobacteria bacterium]
MGSSLEDLKAFPDEVMQTFGFELYYVQKGEMPHSAKPLKGKDLSGVYELKENHEGNTYRAVYIAKLKDKIYVLHCFQKKSKSGIATPPKDMEIIKKRLKLALEDSKKSTMAKEKTND